MRSQSRTRTLALQNTALLWLALAVAAHAATVATPTFNKAHGFYTSSFSVRISSPTSGAAIRYTTDGSKPTSSYGTMLSNGGSITVSKTTCLRACAYQSGMTTSKVFTQTYIFLSHVLTQTRPSDYPAQWGDDTGDYAMDPTIVNDARYRDTIIDDLKSIPSLSLVVKRTDMFSDSGLYWSGGHHGGENIIEKPASIELIYPDGRPGFQVDCGLKAHTGVDPKRSFRLLFKSNYGGPQKLEYPFFEDAPVGGASAIESFGKIILRTGNNEMWAASWTPYGTNKEKVTYLRDEWLRQSFITMTGLGNHGTFMHLYINGMYWGVYNPVERPDARFAADYLGYADKSNWYARNMAGTVSGNATRYNYLFNTLVPNGGFATASRYETVKQYLDVERYCDYILLNNFAHTWDWGNNNWYVVNRNVPAGPVLYMTWDADVSWRATDGSTAGAWVNPSFYDSSDRHYNAPMCQLWRRCDDNPDFLITFADRVYKHCYNGGALTESNCKNRWDGLANYVERAIVGESARWGDHLMSSGHPRYTLDNHWKPARTEVRSMMTGNIDRFISALRSASPRLYPSLDPPTYQRYSGSVAAGFKLTISRNNSTGTVFYRTDGDDPRVSGGAVRTGTDSAGASQVLTINSSTTVKARVKTGGTWSALADATFYVTGGTPPSAPSSPAATALSTSQIRVSWQDNSGNESGFKVDRRQSGADDWVRVQETGANATTYTDSGLPAATTFYYKIKAFNTYGNSAYTATVGDTTEDDTPPPAIAVSSTSIAVSCQEGQNAADATFQVWNSGGGTLQYNCVEGTSFFSIAPTAGSSSGSADKQTHTITFSTSAKAVGTHTRTITVEDDGSGAANGPLAITVEISVTEGPPPTPSGLTAAALSTSEIRVRWNDVDGETQFKIRRSSDGVDFYALDPVFPAANATSWTDAGLAAGESRHYKIRAENDAGVSAYSAAVSATTDSYVPQIVVSTTSISVTCEEGSDAADATFLVWNGGTGTLAYNCVEGTSFFSIAPTDGDSSGSGDKQPHTITFSTSAKAVGTHTRTITVEDDGSGAANGPVEITVEMTITPATPPVTGPFTAYNDLAWETGQLAQNITVYTRSQGGALIDYASGSNLAAQLVLDAGGDGPYLTQGADAAAGTDAHGVFGDIVDCRGLISYETTDLTLTFQNLEPALRYEVVVFGNRDNSGYTDRITKTKILGADAFVNAPTDGADFSGPDDDSTGIANGYNTVNGYVSRYRDIDCGSDGLFQIRVYDNVSVAQPKFYVNAVMLRGYEQTGTPDSDGDGLTDAWEDEHFQDPTAAQPAGNPDNDELTNEQEFILGTDPNTPDASWFSVECVLSGAVLIVGFDTTPASGPGYESMTRCFALEQAAEAGADWSSVTGFSHVVGTGQRVECTVNSGDARLYRGKVWLENND